MSTVDERTDRAAALLREVTWRVADDDDAVIAAAMLAGARRHDARRRAVAAAAVLGSALALAALAALVVLPPGASEPAAQAVEVGALLDVELARGDVLTAVPGASFRVASDVAGVRVLVLEHGAVLFDVRPLGPGERFEVRTPTARVRVVGTVFAVEHGARGTRVEVFEGRVEVEDERGVRSLGAADVYGVAREEGGIDRLEARGREAAARRPVVVARRAEPVPVSEPELADDARADDPVTIEESPARRSAPLEPAEVRRWIAEGRVEDALRASRARRGGAWRFVEGDALRARRDFDDAALLYARASEQLEGDERAQAAYLAASLRLGELGDPAGALTALDRAGVDAEGAPLRERGLVLRARALEALGRAGELAEVARVYLELYPGGSRADWMRERTR